MDNLKSATELISVPSGEKKKQAALSWQDDERIQTFVASGHDLVQKTALGYQLECFRDNVRLQAMPSTHPPGDWGYAASTAYNQARETALRLWDTELHRPGSVRVLWAYCHPIALAMSGAAEPGRSLRTDEYPRGRLFAVYPLTALGQRARTTGGAKESCLLTAPRLLGPRKCNCKDNGRDCSCYSRHTLARRLYSESVTAKGPLKELWNAINDEAQALTSAAIEAWQATRPFEDERRLQAKERKRTAGRAKVVLSGTSTP